MTTATESDPGGIAPALWAVAIVGALLTAGGPTLLGAGSRASLALGALLAVGSLWALSRTVRANGPGWSSDEANATTP